MDREARVRRDLSKLGNRSRSIQTEAKILARNYRLGGHMFGQNQFDECRRPERSKLGIEGERNDIIHARLFQQTAFLFMARELKKWCARRENGSRMRIERQRYKESIVDLGKLGGALQKVSVPAMNAVEVSNNDVCAPQAVRKIG